MASTRPATLGRYRDKRLAGATPEPFAQARIPATGALFVVQQHRARQLHFDFRLEIDGVLRSWAVPKGPSDNPQIKRFAALTEDHPLDYGDFEGRIPEGNYGAGYVILWDRGHYARLNDFESGFAKGKLLFQLYGHKLRGRWTLVRMKSESEWLLIKEQDQYAREPEAHFADDSVVSGMTLTELPQPDKKVNALLRRARRVKGAVTSRRQSTQAPKPMLATSADIFDSKEWLFEFKYDGYRLLIDRDGDDLTLWSRNGNDLTNLFPEVAQNAARLPHERYLIDTEIVRLDERNVPSFSALQQRARMSNELDVARAAITEPCVCFAFDLLQLGDVDLTRAALEKRKALLQDLLGSAGALRYSEHVLGDGTQAYRTACAIGVEGVVAKRRASPYRHGRSTDWLKVRNARTDDFVIVGYTPGRRDATDLGALALAAFDDGELVYVGRVGTGFDAATRRDLMERLQKAPPLPTLAPDASVRWRDTGYVAEVRYTEFTRDGHLRHPVFLRLREDKPPQECTRSARAPTEHKLRPAPAPEVTVTNPDKVFFPEKDFTKKQLVGYYESIAPWMLPYLRERPIVLTRFPDGIHGKSFYQRDAPDFVPDWIRRAVLWSEGAEREVNYFIVENAAALKYLANMGTIPIHSWHARLPSLEHPDWIVLDLDPKTAPFSDVITLARGIGALCDEVDLPAFAKTSGASGLHVLAPVNAQLTHDQAKTLAELLARVIVIRFPSIATIARAVANRHNRVYVDYLQNGHGKLLVAPFSVRAEPAASVSMPLKWSEVNGRLSNQRFHIGNARARMRRLGEDPLAELLHTRADLPRSLALLADIMKANS